MTNSSNSELTPLVIRGKNQRYQENKKDDNNTACECYRNDCKHDQPS